jgi:hypothetical protein
MIDSAPRGWVIQITIPGKPEIRAADAPWRDPSWLTRPPSFKYFNVAVAAPDQAMEATTKFLTGASEPLVGQLSVARTLSAREIAALGLTAGEVRPA